MITRRALLAGAGAAAGSTQARAAAPVRVASKADTEGMLLGALILRRLATGGVPALDRTGLGSTRITRTALLAGEIDLYPEYTGNGAIFFHQEGDPVWRDRDAGWARVKALDAAANALVWLPCAPADNGWTIAVRRATAAARRLGSMSDYGRWVRGGGRVLLAASAEFVESPAALPAFEAAYGFRLARGQIIALAGGNTAATLRATAEAISGVDCGMAYHTDGALDALGLVTLADDRHAQVAYAPAPVARAAVCATWPAIGPLLAPVFARLDAATLRRLNARIAVDGADAADVASTWLRTQGLAG